MTNTLEDALSSQSNDQLEMVKYSAGTDVGMRREENQDSYGILLGEGYRLFIVADGMGGVQGGSIASNLAIAAIERQLRDRANLNVKDVVSAIEEANSQVHIRGEQDTNLSGMGTTIVALFITHEAAYAIHVGDSRAYQIKKDSIVRLTEDHTLVQELVRSGAISEAQAEHHPVAHMLTRSIGPSAKIEVTVTKLEKGVDQNDKFLLCSDGLYNMIKDTEILEILNAQDTDSATQYLIDLANERGGSDNITIIIVDTKEFQISDNVTATVVEKVSAPATDTGYHQTADVVNEPVQIITPIPVAEAIAEIQQAKDEFVSKHLVEELQPITALVPRSSLILGGFLCGLLVSYFLFSYLSANTSTANKIETQYVNEKANQIEHLDVKHVAPKIGPAEKSSIQKRKHDLESLLKDIDSKLTLLMASSKTDVESLEKQALKRSDDLKAKIEQLRVDIDIATRKLATWYDRKRRLETTDMVNMASELAVSVQPIKSKKDEFEKATWDYLREVEALRYAQSDSTREDRVAMLVKIRSEKMKELSNEVHSTIDKSLSEADDVVAMVTLQRSSLEKELEEVKEDLDFARIALGAEPDKKEGMISTLERRKTAISDELLELTKLLAS